MAHLLYLPNIMALRVCQNIIILKEIVNLILVNPVPAEGGGFAHFQFSFNAHLDFKSFANMFCIFEFTGVFSKMYKLS